FFPLFPVPAIGSAKVSKSFELTSKQGKFLFFLFCSLCCEQPSVKAIRGAKVRIYFDFQTAFSTFVAKTDLCFKALNPVDSWRGAKVRGFFQEPRPAENFFFVSFSAHLRSIWECKSTGNS
ncbi:hypothetical protein ACVWYF_001657, partial [Hymenobacter sp. UYAg731]